MEGRYGWMDESLRRMSDQAREVLARARGREVDWWAAERRGGMEVAEDDGNVITLQEAFTATADFMRHTAERCKAYHGCIPAQRMDEQEKQHISRFHHRGPAQRAESRLSSLAAPRTQSGMQRSHPQDVHIEVAPGTYRISAGSPHCQAQACVVHVLPGQIVDLTFHV